MIPVLSSAGSDYQVSWVGMDGSWNEDERPTLELAQAHAVAISEHGGHTITVSDVDGNEYDF